VARPADTQMVRPLSMHQASSTNGRLPVAGWPVPNSDRKKVPSLPTGQRARRSDTVGCCCSRAMATATARGFCLCACGRVLLPSLFGFLLHAQTNKMASTTARAQPNGRITRGDRVHRRPEPLPPRHPSHLPFQFGSDALICSRFLGPVPNLSRQPARVLSTWHPALAHAGGGHISPGPRFAARVERILVPVFLKYSSSGRRLTVSYVRSNPLAKFSDGFSSGGILPATTPARPRPVPR
jgi:hypothetical protein